MRQEKEKKKSSERREREGGIARKNRIRAKEILKIDVGNIYERFKVAEEERENKK